MYRVHPAVPGRVLPAPASLQGVARLRAPEWLLRPGCAVLRGPRLLLLCLAFAASCAPGSQMSQSRMTMRRRSQSSVQRRCCLARSLLCWAASAQPREQQQWTHLACSLWPWQAFGQACTRAPAHQLQASEPARLCAMLLTPAGDGSAGEDGPAGQRWSDAERLR